MEPESSKCDVLCLGILAGLCLLVGVHQIRHCTLINPDGVLYISLAQQLPGDYIDVARQYPAGSVGSMRKYSLPMFSPPVTPRPCSVSASISHSFS